MDHFLQVDQLGGPTEPMLEAYSFLSAVAARVPRIELGTLVTGVTYRNPALLAKMVTTLDIISGGRAVLGIGAAWFEEEHAAMGYVFPSIRERLERVGEAVQICRLLFQEDRPSFSGRYYNLAAMPNLPRPVRPGGPPILIGGEGTQRTLRLVARYADRCNFHGQADNVRQKTAVLRQHCHEIGRDPAEIRITRLGALCLTKSGTETQTVLEMMRKAAAGTAYTYNVGTESDLLGQIQELVEAGVEDLIFSLPLATTPEAVNHIGSILTDRFA